MLYTKHRVFKLSTKKSRKNKRYTPRGGRGTCYLVVVVVGGGGGDGLGGGGGGGVAVALWLWLWL